MGGKHRQHAACGCIMLFLLALPGAASAATYVFDDAGYLGDAALMPDWADMLTRQEADQAEFTACVAQVSDCLPQYKGVRRLLEKARELPADRQIKLVNYYVNKRRYKRDRSRTMTTPLTTGEVKYRSRWSTVSEFLVRGGDCEDYATTKYFLLRELGVPIEQMRVVIGWDRMARGHHAVLAVHRPDGDIWLLDTDNRIHHRKNTGYRYIYAVNENSVWDLEQAPPATPAVEEKATT